jgi:hypothetical protein
MLLGATVIGVVAIYSLKDPIWRGLDSIINPPSIERTISEEEAEQTSLEKLVGEKSSEAYLRRYDIEVTSDNVKLHRGIREFDPNAYAFKDMISAGAKPEHLPGIRAFLQDGDWDEFSVRRIYESGAVPSEELLLFYKELKSFDCSVYSFCEVLKAGARLEHADVIIKIVKNKGRLYHVQRLFEKFGDRLDFEMLDFYSQLVPFGCDSYDFERIVEKGAKPEHASSLVKVYKEGGSDYEIGKLFDQLKKLGIEPTKENVDFFAELYALETRQKKAKPQVIVHKEEKLGKVDEIIFESCLS